MSNGTEAGTALVHDLHSSTQPFFSSNGAVLESTGAPGQTRVFEHSTDLIAWTPFSTNVAGPGGLIRMTNGPAAGSGYFRVRGLIGP